MFRSYCLTVRPLLGLSKETEDALFKWISKLDYAYMCIEKTGASRHAHIQVWFNEARSRGDVCKALQRILERTVEDFNTCQKKVLRQGVRIAYSDWYLDYLAENENKEGDEKGIEVYSNTPDKTLDYYPSEEEQEKTKELNDSADPRFTKLEQQFYDWIEEGTEITLGTVCVFLSDLMFNRRLIPVKVNKRDRHALAETLHLYITRSTDGNAFRHTPPKVTCPPSWYEDLEPNQNIVL